MKKCLSPQYWKIGILLLISKINLMHSGFVEGKIFLQNSLESPQINTTSQICSYENCPFSQGVCYDNKCLCAYGFKTLSSASEPQINCNYHQKSKMTAFLLEFFFPFGLGHYYAGKFYFAIAKLVLFVFLFCNFCGELVCMNLRIFKLFICSTLFAIAFSCMWLTFQSIDLLCYLTGLYNDGYGISMI
jgi:hypothetical protein